MSLNIVETKDYTIISSLNREVQNLHAELEPNIFKPYSEERMMEFFKDVLSKENIHGLIAIYDNQPVGYVLYSERNLSETVYRYAYSVLMVEHICVLSEHRKSNIGKALMNKVKEIAAEKSITRIELDCWTKNPHAGEFFSSQGFQVFNQRMYVEV